MSENKIKKRATENISPAMDSSAVKSKPKSSRTYRQAVEQGVPPPEQVKVKKARIAELALIAQQVEADASLAASMEQEVKEASTPDRIYDADDAAEFNACDEDEYVNGNLLTISESDFKLFERLKEASRRESAGLPALPSATTISLGDGSFQVKDLMNKNQCSKLLRLWQLYNTNHTPFLLSTFLDEDTLNSCCCLTTRP